VCLKRGFPASVQIIFLSFSIVCKRPFKFENMWLKKEGFGALLKQWWDSYHFQDSPSFIFACKIKAIKMNLKKWNEEVFDNIESNKSKLLDDLKDLDAIEEVQALDSVELAKKGEVSRELEACLLMEERLAGGKNPES
jgi:hypothetical protein